MDEPRPDKIPPRERELRNRRVDDGADGVKQLFLVVGIRQPGPEKPGRRSTAGQRRRTTSLGKPKKWLSANHQVAAGSRGELRSGAVLRVDQPLERSGQRQSLRGALLAVLPTGAGPRAPGHRRRDKQYKVVVADDVYEAAQFFDIAAGLRAREAAGAPSAAEQTSSTRSRLSYRNFLLSTSSNRQGR